MTSYLIPPISFSQQVDHKEPLNMRPEWSDLFKPQTVLPPIKLGARRLSNVFVNHYGLVIDNGLLVKGCAPNIGHTSYDDDNFHYRHWKKAAEQMLTCRYGKSLRSVKLADDRTYLIVHSPWFSYYFWMTECLPRLLMVKDELKDLTLIYPEWWDNLAFVKESLSLIPELSIERIPHDVHVFVKNLIMPEVKPWSPMFLPEQILATRNFLNPIPPANAVGGIYLSRRKNKRRKMSDEDRVEKMVMDIGFEVIDTDDLTLSEQIRTMSKARSALSVTGAGLTNIMFMPDGAKFLDLTNKQYFHRRKYTFHYSKLCNIVKVRYLVQLCEHEDDPSASNYTNQNLIPDYRLLKENIELLIS